jgi:hypothetical protein
MHSKFFSVIALSLVLAACGAQYAFPLSAPGSDVLDEKYKAWKHELTQDDNYHFRILVPEEWKILQTTVALRPEGEKPLEIALFREPGAWMEDETIPAEGEIVVEVFTVSGSLNTGGAKDEAPMKWLKKKLEEGAGSFKVLEERTFQGTHGPVADLLARTGDSEGYVVSRFAAFHSPTNSQEIFVIAASATEEGYSRVAEAFITAIETFRLENAPLPKAGTGSSAR